MRHAGLQIAYGHRFGTCEQYRLDHAFLLGHGRGIKQAVRILLRLVRLLVAEIFHQVFPFRWRS
jgi:hypothetical protein